MKRMTTIKWFGRPRCNAELDSGLRSREFWDLNHTIKRVRLSLISCLLLYGYLLHEYEHNTYVSQTTLNPNYTLCCTRSRSYMLTRLLLTS